MKINKQYRTSKDGGESGLEDNRESLHSPLKYYPIEMLLMLLILKIASTHNSTNQGDVGGGGGGGKHSHIT